MDIDPNDPNQQLEQPPDLESARRTMSKEWLLVFGFVGVIILIIALTAYHLTHGG